MPRGRSRKRDTRMDAALDAMRPYGFGANLVYKTVQELLKVYGEEGWVFIEEAAYRVLIDAILEKEKDQEAEDENEVVPASSSVQVVLDTTSRSNEAMESASMSNASLHSPPFTVSSPLPMDGFPPRRRKPCFGWIDSDEELDIVELTPALPQAAAHH